MASLGVVIPSYNRGEVLLDTLAYLFEQSTPADEIWVIDQTLYAEGDETAIQLARLHQANKIKWVQRNEPSIPKAMNHGLLCATTDWVLFLDDDVSFAADFIENHRKSIRDVSPLAQVGQVVQPWQEPNKPSTAKPREKGLYRDLVFEFNSDTAQAIENCMAGNLCVNRAAAIAAGGFDEQYFGVAYRFETEFCKRFCAFHKTEFWYSPVPLLHHLHANKGGTRAHANFLTSPKPVHSMGDYYYCFLHGRGWQRVLYIFTRFFSGLMAKFYLRKPWYLPVRMVGELRGLLAALIAMRQGPRLIRSEDVESAKEASVERGDA